MLFESATPKTSATQWASWNGEYLWHLDRLDELSWSARDSQHNMCTLGGSVWAFVIDTGVEVDHPQFGVYPATRVIHSLDFTADTGYVGAADFSNACTSGSPTNSNNWHGTAVGSVLAGTQVGAAKVKVISLKVARCSDRRIESRSLINAINWVGSAGNPYRADPAVINHSGFLAPWDSQAAAFGDAVHAVVTQTSIPFFTSADNFSTDACRFSPNYRAYTKFAKTGRTVFVVGGTAVGTSSTDPNDYRMQLWETVNGAILPRIGQDSGSNAGACVSVYAPGTSIYAARHKLSASLYGRADGTSFSSPLVAAVAARWIEKYTAQHGVRPTYVQVYEWLLAQAQTPVYGVQTPEYYLCAGVFGQSATTTYRPGSQPSTCPALSVGTFGQVTPANPNSPPFHFPSVGNSSDARMVFWDEGYCP